MSLKQTIINNLNETKRLKYLDEWSKFNKTDQETFLKLISEIEQDLIKTSENVISIPNFQFSLSEKKGEYKFKTLIELYFEKEGIELEFFGERILTQHGFYSTINEFSGTRFIVYSLKF